jgi:hypothetical protein
MSNGDEKFIALNTLKGLKALSDMHVGIAPMLL